MHRRANVVIATLLILGGQGAGCSQPTRTVGNTPMIGERSAAFKQLDRFVGEWEVVGELRGASADKPVGLQGMNEAGWEGGGGILLARGRTRVGDGAAQQGLGAWTYDTEARIYRGVVIDGSGAVGIGTAEFDESTATWQGRITGEGPTGKLHMEGSVHFVDANTKQEHWTGRDDAGRQVFEIEKTERRRR